MNRLTIDIEALRHNIRTIDAWVLAHDASWTLATKVLCGHLPTLQGLDRIGVRSVADSRLDNMKAVDSLGPHIESWYLRLPHLSVIPDIVRLADVSLNTEVDVMEALDAEAARQDKLHRIVIMLELGDLREGVLPGSLTRVYERVFELPHIEVLGIGSNLGCLSGAIPNVDQFAELSLYHELLELKFGRKLPVISAGTSAVLPLLRDGQLPRTINHFRIGESVFLGSDLVTGGTMEGLRDDAVTLDVEVAEVKEKSLRPTGETNDMMPFEAFDESEPDPGQRGQRAVLTVGQLDTEVRGLRPVDPGIEVVGASSDLTVVNLGDNRRGVKVGDTLSFRPSYGAFVRLMMDRYIDKVVIDAEPDGGTLESRRATAQVDVPPILDNVETGPVDPPAARRRNPREQEAG